MIEPRWIFERASPAESSRCDRCEQALDAGEPRVEAKLNRCWTLEQRLRFALHPACAIDVDTPAFAALLAQDTADFADRDALSALCAARLRSILDRHDAAPDDGLDDRASDARTPPVLPARDRAGRPRVRVSILSNGEVLRSPASRSFWDLLRVRQSWCSPRREYVFESTGGALSYVDDPAQPIVAHVYVTNAKKRALQELSIDLWMHRAQGFPPPLLWLIGIKQWSRTDDNVLAVRERVAEQGIDPDACPVLCATKIDARALDALTRALDEHFDGREYRFARAPTVVYAQALERDLQRGHRYSDLVLGSIGHRLRMRPTAQSKAVNERIALQLVAQGSLSVIHSFLTEKTHVSVAPLRAWFEAARANDAAPMQRQHTAEARVGPMLELYVAFDRGEAVRAATELLLALERPPRFEGRLPYIRAQIERFVTGEDGPMLRDALREAPSDEHRRELSALIAATEATAAPR